MKVEYLNPVIDAAIFVFKQVCNEDLIVGKPMMSATYYENQTLAVSIGITGDLRGQVFMAMSAEAGCKIASKMMYGMHVDELNDMAISAISELFNMLMGNAMTHFFTKEIKLDITPPSIWTGSNIHVAVSDSKMIGIPLSLGDIELELNMAIKPK